jgi:hypothetical protein
MVEFLERVAMLFGAIGFVIIVCAVALPILFRNREPR